MKIIIAFIVLATCISSFGAGYDLSGGISQDNADARYLQLSGTTQDITGNIEVSGYVHDRPCRAYAYLTTPSNTTISSAGVWYPVDGIFSNVVADGFGTTTVDGKPAIIYTNGYSGRFIVRLLAGVQSASASATIGLTTKINNITNSLSGVPSYTYCKNAGEQYTIVNFGIPNITNGTTIQLMTTSDKTGDITFNQFKAKMERWR